MSHHQTINGDPTDEENCHGCQEAMDCQYCRDCCHYFPKDEMCRVGKDWFCKDCVDSSDAHTYDPAEPLPEEEKENEYE